MPPHNLEQRVPPAGLLRQVRWLPSWASHSRTTPNVQTHYRGCCGQHRIPVAVGWIPNPLHLWMPQRTFRPSQALYTHTSTHYQHVGLLEPKPSMVTAQLLHLPPRHSGCLAPETPASPKPMLPSLPPTHRWPVPLLPLCPWDLMRGSPPRAQAPAWCEPWDQPSPLCSGQPPTSTSTTATLTPSSFTTNNGPCSNSTRAPPLALLPASDTYQR